MIFVRRKFGFLLAIGSVLLFLTLYRLSYNSTLQSSPQCEQTKSNTEKSENCVCDKAPKKIEKDLSSMVSPLACHINGDVMKNIGTVGTENSRKVNCLIMGEGKKSDEVYLPFSFIKSYFDVMGEVRTNKGNPYFSWSHSYSRVFPHLKDQKYDPGGSFMQFAGFDVENRPRVKCVTASQGVPITTQWDPKGYYYPTQVCQYALAHWSKYVQEKAFKMTVYEDGDQHQANWLGGDTTRVLSQKCIQFEDQIHLPLNNDKKEYILSFDLQFRENVTITVTLRSPQAGRVKLRYIPHLRVDVDRTGRMAMFGYGLVQTESEKKKLKRQNPNDVIILEGEWKRFTRNLLNDLAKGLPHKNMGSQIKVEEISFEGVGCVTNMSLATRQSLRFFFHAADWLVQQQDSKGGWPVDITLNKDRSKYSEAEEIKPGWYSGMGQGHAISVLTRAYRESKDEKYLSAAVKAINLFKIPSSEGGFVARFMDTSYIWYEEYPTNPSSFILNGFMYSLLGLYDLSDTLKDKPNYQTEMVLSRKLFDDGIASLRAILAFYDTGSGSVYDLRHFTMGTAPKVARWDYHSAHLNLLYTLSTLIEDANTKAFFLSTADRWLGYMLGNRSKHN